MTDQTPLVRIEGLSKHFGDTVALDNLTLDIARGEFVTFLGPSGCGKSTTLRILGGFERPTCFIMLRRDAAWCARTGSAGGVRQGPSAAAGEARRDRRPCSTRRPAGAPAGAAQSSEARRSRSDAPGEMEGSPRMARTRRSCSSEPSTSPKRGMQRGAVQRAAPRRSHPA